MICCKYHQIFLCLIFYETHDFFWSGFINNETMFILVFKEVLKVVIWLPIFLISALAVIIKHWLNLFEIVFWLVRIVPFPEITISFINLVLLCMISFILVQTSLIAVLFSWKYFLKDSVWSQIMIFKQLNIQFNVVLLLIQNKF